MRSAWPLALLLIGCSAELDQRALPIVGGVETTQYPEVGALTWDGDFLCSAVLVGPRKLVTAAHCLYGFENDPAPLAAVFAPNASTSPDPPTDVVEVVVHPEYGTAPSRDIAVAWLGADAPVAPVPWSEEVLGDSHLGADVLLVGYGDPAYEDDAGDRVRRLATVALAEVTSTHLRWTDPGTGTCHGDSGGGAFMDLGGGPVLIGVHSEGDPQCAGWGSATRTDVFAGFLDDPSASGDDDDTGVFGDDDDAVEGPGGCGCAATPGAGGGWLLLLALGATRGLRRSARAPRPLRRAGSPPRP